MIGCDVVTERGTYIGRVRDFEFDPDDGLVQRIVVDCLVRRCRLTVSKPVLKVPMIYAL